jgi:hypothetical protein
VSSNEGPPGAELPGEGTDPAAPAAPSADLLLWRRVACGLMGLQAAGLALVALSALVLLVTGGVQVAQNALLLGIFTILAALGVGFVARELLRGHARVRTAALFWQLLLLLISFSVFGAGSKVLAVGLAVLAVATAVATVGATRQA